MHGTSNDDWTPCEQGQLRRLADQLNRPRPTSGVRTAAAAAAGSAALVLAVGLALSMLGGAEPAVRLSCPEVGGLLPAYAAGGCEPAVRSQIQEHLDHCRHCEERLEEIQAGHAAADRDRLTQLAALWADPGGRR